MKYRWWFKKFSGGLSIFCEPGRNLGARTPCELEEDEFEQAHIYILKNFDEVLPFLDYVKIFHIISLL